jgi:hypothetical protein
VFILIPVLLIKEILSTWNSLVILRAANSDSGRLPRGNQKRAIVRTGLRGRHRPEVKNSAINTYPAAVLQHVFVFIDSAIVDRQTDILKPFPVLRVIFKQAQQ